jgi:hypothetical protein
VAPRDLGRRIAVCWARWREFLVMAAAGLLVLLPQFIFWRVSSGNWIFNSYDSAFDDYGRSVKHTFALADVLFSFRKGVFIWTPIWVFILGGFFFMRRTWPEWRLAVPMLLLLQLILICSMPWWEAGGSFGQRYLTEFLVLAALPLSALLVAPLPRLGRWLLWAGLFACVAWSLFLIKVYYTREVSVYGLDGHALYDLFWSRWAALRTWWRG